MDRIKLNTLGSKTTISPEQFELIKAEVEGYGVTIRQLDASSFDAVLEGVDSVGKRRQGEVNIKDYLKNMREIEKLMTRVEKWRSKLGVQQFENLETARLFQEKSSKLEGIKGYKNYMKTLKKILTKDPETNRNRIEEADFNVQELRKVKMEAYEDPVSMLQGLLGEDFDKKKYFKSNGEYKSKKAEREVRLLFAETVESADYINSDPEFFDWLFNKLGNEYTNIYRSMTIEERITHYAEFKTEELTWIKEGAGSITRYDYEITDEEIDFRINKLAKSLKKGGRK